MKRLTWRELNHVLALKTEEEVLQMLQGLQVSLQMRLLRMRR